MSLQSALLLIKLIPLLLLCCVGPGLLIVRRLQWSPMEKLCGVLAASFIVTYLVAFALFCANAPTWAYWTASGLFALMGMSGRSTASLLIRNRSTRAALLSFVALLAWYAIHLAMVRNYSGGDWQGDWREHYQRTQYFLGQLPDDYRFLGVYALPARPPLMNVIAAFFCRQAGANFQAYQLVFLCLNAWTFLPCCLLMRFFGRRTGRFIAILALLFMLNPSIVQNATLTVTKAFTAGMVVLGLCFYLRGRILPAGLSLAAGLLAHYSAGPYAAAIGLHYLFQLARGRRSARQAMIAGAAAAALLATWFVWSALVYGPRVTFLSNTTTSGTMARSPQDNLRKTLHNLLSSAIPHPLRPIPGQYEPFSPPRNWGDLRDYYFMMAQTTLPTMVGFTSGAVALALIAQYFFGKTISNRRQWSFWLFFLIFSYVAAVAVDPGWRAYGTGFATLQPLALMGVTLVAARLPTLRPAFFWLVWIGLAIDYALGILLEFDRQSYVYPTTTDAAGRLLILPDNTLGGTGAQEYIEKLRAGYVFWGDRLAGISTILELASIVIAVFALWHLTRLRARWVRQGTDYRKLADAMD